jgi:3-phenylpropionate/trans-cinnamate dioxygenase ferredoxin reductase component
MQISKRSMVIVGAGHCGGRAAQALREFGWQGRIDLIGAEPHAPYERPPLSKGLLTGERSADECRLRSAEDEARDHITRHTDTAESIDTATCSVRLRSGASIAYESLLLATGGLLRRLPIPGANLPGVLGLRTLDDAHTLAQRLQPGARVVIIGGGFIGLEVAASAIARGCQVTVVEGAPRLLARAVPAVMAQQMLALHSARGVTVHLGVAPQQILMTGSSLAVQLADGLTLAADTVLVGIGIEPAAALARAAGLTVNQGVLVNAELATSAPGVFAAGDVAEFPSPLSGNVIRQETWHNAETQARVAAHNMLGAHVLYDSMPWFWSDQYDHQLQVCGEPALAQHSVTRSLSDTAMLEFYLAADDRLVGVSGWGPTTQVAKELKLARTLLERGIRVSAAALGDPQVKLKSLLSASVPA